MGRIMWFVLGGIVCGGGGGGGVGYRQITGVPKNTTVGCIRINTKYVNKSSWFNGTLGIIIYFKCLNIAY